MFHMDKYKFVGLKDVVELDNVWHTNEALENLGLTADDFDLVRVEPLLTDDLEGWSSLFMVYELVKHGDNKPIASLTKYPTKLK